MNQIIPKNKAICQKCHGHALKKERPGLCVGGTSRALGAPVIVGVQGREGMTGRYLTVEYHSVVVRSCGFVANISKISSSPSTKPSKRDSSKGLLLNRFTSNTFDVGMLLLAFLILRIVLPFIIIVCLKTSVANTVPI